MVTNYAVMMRREAHVSDVSHPRQKYVFYSYDIICLVCFLILNLMSVFFVVWRDWHLSCTARIHLIMLIHPHHYITFFTNTHYSICEFIDTVEQFIIK